MLKRIFVLTLLLAGVIFWSCYAAIPQIIGYEGRLTNSSGDPVITSKTFTFKIYSVETGGSPVTNGTSIETITPDSNGIFNAAIAFQSGVFDGANRWMGVQVGSDSEMTPRIQIASAAHAYKTLQADQADNSTTAAGKSIAAYGGDIIPFTASGSGKLDSRVIPANVTGISSSGATVLTGEVTLVPGNNVTLTQIGQNITITSAGTGGGGVTSVSTGRGLQSTPNPITTTGIISIDSTVLTVDAATQGDILYYDGSKWARLGYGTNGNFLKTQGVSANPTWASLPGGGNMSTSVYDLQGVAEQLVGTSAAQTLTNKTLTTPTIESFVNAAHDHSNAANGGSIPESSVSGLTSDLSDKATKASLTGHTIEAHAVHGLEPGSAVVGTSDAQVLTGKTIDASQLVNNSITASKMGAKSVTQAAISTEAGPTGNQFLRWSGSALEWATPVSGGGSVTVDAMTINYTSYPSLEVMDNGITASKIANNTITVDKMASNSITSDAIVAGAVTASKLDPNINFTTNGVVTAAAFSGNGAKLSGVVTGVSSSGATALTGEVSFVPGSNITITQLDHNITIATGASVGTVTSITAGRGLQSTPNPIQSTGVISIDSTVVTTETDPVWSGDKSSYSTTAVANGLYLGLNAKAANSSSLEGHNAAYFQAAGSYVTTETDPVWSGDKSSYSTTAVANGLYLGLNAKAANSSSLEGHNAAYFQVAGSYVTTETDPVWSGDKSSYSTTAVANGLYLGLNAKAANSSSLEGHNAAYFQVAGSYVTTETDPVWSGDKSSYSTTAVANGLYLGLNAKAANSSSLEGHNAAYFQVAGSYLTQEVTDTLYLGIHGTADNSSSLEGHNAAYFQVAGSYLTKAVADGLYLGTTETAANASLLQNHNAAYFQVAGSYLTQEVTDTLYLGIHGTADNSSSLEGHNAAYFQVAGSYLTKAVADGLYLGTTETAANTSLLENHNAAYFQVAGNYATTGSLTGHTIESTAVHGLQAGSTVVGTSDTQTLSGKTLTTPTIADFTNAAHNHSNAAGGGSISGAAITSGIIGGTAGMNTTGVVTAAAIYGTFEGTYTGEDIKSAAFIYPYATAEASIRLPFNATITSLEVEVEGTNGTAVTGRVSVNESPIGTAAPTATGINSHVWAVGAVSNPAYVKNQNLEFEIINVTGAPQSATVLIKYKRAP